MFKWSKIKADLEFVTVDGELAVFKFSKITVIIMQAHIIAQYTIITFCRIGKAPKCFHQTGFRGLTAERVGVYHGVYLTSNAYLLGASSVVTEKKEKTFNV